MIDRDLVELLGALVVIIACALSAIATASPRERERVGRRARRARRRLPNEVASSGEMTAESFAAAAAAAATAPGGGRTRPRILTGEPAPAEQRRPATRRAAKLVVGIATLAAVVAVGLLALVRALVAMFNRIGG